MKRFFHKPASVGYAPGTLVSVAREELRPLFVRTNCHIIGGGDCGLVQGFIVFGDFKSLVDGANHCTFLRNSSAGECCFTALYYGQAFENSSGGGIYFCGWRPDIGQRIDRAHHYSHGCLVEHHRAVYSLPVV